MIFFLCSWITKVYDYYGSVYQSAERNKMLADKTAEEHIRPKGSCMFYWDDPVPLLKKITTGHCKRNRWSHQISTTKENHVSRFPAVRKISMLHLPRFAVILLRMKKTHVKMAT